MYVLNIHGEAGIDFLGKYANGIDPTTAAKMSGVPQDWIEGVMGIAEREHAVIGLRDTNSNLENLRGDVLPKTSEDILGPNGETWHITSIPEKDEFGNPLHPPFKTNSKTGLVEVKFEVDGEPMTYVVVGKMNESGQVDKSSLQLKPKDDVIKDGVVQPSKDGMLPMGPDVDLYFTWRKTDTGYVHLENNTPAEASLRGMIADLMTVEGVPYMTHGPYTSWAPTAGAPWNRGPGLVALDNGRLVWLNENDVEKIFDLHGALYPSGVTGVLDQSARPLLENEKSLAEFLLKEGHCVQSLPEGGLQRGGDVLLNGLETEFKTLDPGATDATVKNSINNSIRRGGQARNIIVDARGSGLTSELAEKGLARASNITRGRVDGVRIIGDNFDITSVDFR